MSTVGQILIFSILKTITAIVFSTTILFSHTLLAQWQESFADGEFASNPEWLGDTDAFVVENEKLRLSAPPAAGTAVLVTHSPGAYGTWEFGVILDFNPSGSNFARIYLISDQSDLTAPLNGYFVLVGGSGDEIALYKQTGETRSKVIDGIDGRVNLSRVDATIRVTRQSDGHWHLFSKLESEAGFFEEGNALDNQSISSSWLGLQCLFTSTRSNRFYVDDLSFTPESPVDTVPPKVVSATAIASDRLDVVFSEPIPEAVLFNIQMYRVSGGIGHPNAIEPLDRNAAVTLVFGQEFENNLDYSLTVGPVSDEAGNEIPVQEIDFRFAKIAKAIWKDIIVTEIFCDPSPSIGLPEFEFVEIFNRSPNALSLANWTLSDLTGSASIGDRLLLPGEYLILTSSAAQSAYQSYGESIALTRFPSLNNAADAIVLKDEAGRVIDSIYYDDSWYRDSDKKSGGWTLELIDPANVCAEKDNWAASESDNGGSPGATNSIYAEKPDLNGPRLVQAYAMLSDVVNLTFNEKLENRIPEPAQFEFSRGLGVQNVVLNPNLREVLIHLDTPLESGQLYNILIRNIYDCAGNIIADGHNSAEFALPQPADSLDVVINEILFNPRPDGVDFVELVNRSKKFLDLNGWQVGELEDGVCTNKKMIIARSQMLKPDSITAITPNAGNIRKEYVNSTNLLEAALPPLNDDYGSVCVTDPEGKVIDVFHYSADMHSPFLRDKEGVSLERLSANGASGDPENWKSASSSVGFATPGYPNSNNVFIGSGNEEIRVEPEVFIPENGQPNFATIHYSLEPSDQVANIIIFDSSGRQVKTIVQNALLGASGFLRWEGDLDDGTRARVGVYMIKVELFDRAGSTRVIMRRVVLAGRF